MKRRWKIVVSGRVQGVFYRATARSKAEDLQLSGFARNEPDGSVLIEVEGSAESLEIFRAWCERGPAGASVKNVEVVEMEVRGSAAFTIQR